MPFSIIYNGLYRFYSVTFLLLENRKRLAFSNVFITYTQ